MVISVHAPLEEVLSLMRKQPNEEKQPTLETNQVAEDSKPSTDGIPQQTYPWLIETCIELVAWEHVKDVQPMVVRIEAIQVLIAFVRNYFDIIRYEKQFAMED